MSIAIYLKIQDILLIMRHMNFMLMSFTKYANKQKFLRSYDTTIDEAKWLFEIKGETNVKATSKMEQQSIFVVQCLSYNAFNKLLYYFQSGKIDDQINMANRETLRYEQTEDNL
jgi:hypothetical protein